MVVSDLDKPFEMPHFILNRGSLQQFYTISRLYSPYNQKPFGKAIPFSQCCLFQLNNLIVLKITLNNDFVSTICRLLYDM